MHIICNVEKQYAFFCVSVGGGGQTKSIIEVAPKYFFSLESLERSISTVCRVLWLYRTASSTPGQLKISCNYNLFSLFWHYRHLLWPDPVPEVSLEHNASDLKPTEVGGKPPALLALSSLTTEDLVIKSLYPLSWFRPIIYFSEFSWIFTEFCFLILTFIFSVCSKPNLVCLSNNKWGPGQFLGINDWLRGLMAWGKTQGH